MYVKTGKTVPVQAMTAHRKRGGINLHNFNFGAKWT